VLMNLTPPVAVQWQFNGGNIPGATNATFALAAAQPTNSGNYTVVVSNAAGAVTSPAVMLRALAATNGSAPFVTLATPADGGIYPAGASVSLSADVAANGHAIGKVQFFNGAALLGEDASPPYALIWTNVSAGFYTVVAQAVYDVTNRASSAAALIQTVTAPATPQNFAIAGVVSNRVSLAWTASPNAAGYLISRGGLPLAGVSGTTFVDAELPVGSTYCYTVVATNAAGSSASSGSLCATVPMPDVALAWDAVPGLGGAQDGSGTWGFSSANWWYPSSNFSWGDNHCAVFGLNTTTNCTVTLVSDVAPAGITFNATSGGSYTLAGTNALCLTNTPALTANRAATITAPVKGDGFVKAGTGTLTFNSSASRSVGVTNLTINDGQVTLNNGYTVLALADYAVITVNSNGTLYLSSRNSLNNNVSIVVNGGTVTGSERTDLYQTLTMNGGIVSGSTALFGHWNDVVVNSPASTVLYQPPPILAGGNWNVARGAAAVDLDVSGAIATDWSSGKVGLKKTGTGIMALSGTNTYTGPTSVNGGTLLVNGSIGTNVVTVASGAMLGGTGTLNGAVTIQSGGTLAPGGSGIGTLTLNSAPTLPVGSATLIAVSKNGSVLTNGMLRAASTFNPGGTLIVTNIGPDALVLSNSFRILNVNVFGAGNFAATDLPPLSLGLGWNTSQLKVSGTITVVATEPVVPPALGVAAAGGLLTLSWPTAYTTYTLQMQTNAPSIGLGTNWVNVTSGVVSNSYTVTINPADGAAFYRLIQQ
jgi:autotransporter-associated beta strand protein